MLEKTTKMNMLYDFYAELLTEKQKEYMGLYYREDFSLGEIANLRSVSRQAIYDNIKRTEQMLENYEEKLHLYDKFLLKQEVIQQLEAALKSIKDADEEIFQLLVRLKDLD